MDSPRPVYDRVLLKLSGESLLGKQSYGIDIGAAAHVAREIRDLHAMGVQVAIMIGGGNIFRGIEGSARGMARTQAAYMGMLATVINSLALQCVL